MRVIALAAAMLIALSLPAEARRYHHKRHVVSVAHGDVRPRAWCGWWMRQQLGITDRAGDVARWWAGYGRRAAGPGNGVIVVWAHHVGIITGGSPGAWIVKSGNDGNAVRERVLPIDGAIAFRWPA